MDNKTLPSRLESKQRISGWQISIQLAHLSNHNLHGLILMILSSIYLKRLLTTSLLFCSAVCVSFSAYSAEKLSAENRFQKFANIYEPSGIEQLPDGRFMVVEDESDYALSVVDFKPNGQVTEIRLEAQGKLADLEAVTLGKDGFIYAMTSHAKTKQGKRSRHREQLVRFKLQGNQITEFTAFHSLRDAIVAQHPSLKDGNEKFDDDLSFNIEGLSFDADKKVLLIGIRSPIDGKKALIVTLQNPQGIFELAQKPNIGTKLIKLNLKGGGIRSITYDVHLDGYLIASRKQGKAFKLWFWDGHSNSKPKTIKIAGLKDLRHLEGISSATLPDGTAGIMLVSDDGDAEKNRPGHFVFVSYAQLKLKD